MLGSVGSNPSASSTEPGDVSSPQQTYGNLEHSSSSGGPMQLRELLQESAQAVSVSDWDRAHRALRLLSRRISLTGDSFERVASFFAEALAIRFSRASGTEVSVFSKPVIQSQCCRMAILNNIFRGLPTFLFFSLSNPLSS